MRSRSIRSWAAAIGVATYGLLSGCQAIEDLAGPAAGAYDGSHTPLQLATNAPASPVAPTQPLTQIVPGLLGMRTANERGDGIGVERWFWVVGPEIVSETIRLDKLALVEIIGGTGVVNRDGEDTLRLSGGVSFIIAAGQEARISNASRTPLDMKVALIEIR
ncbi:MAG: hypothetical protein AAF439_12125 [Pseudomonadota bacterium]